MWPGARQGARGYDGNRRAVFLVRAGPAPAAGDSYKIVEDTASLDVDHALIAKADLEPCFKGAEHAGSAVFWAELRGGKVVSARVHGAGKLDACFARALEKAKPADKTAAVILGHIDAV